MCASPGLTIRTKGHELRSNFMAAQGLEVADYSAVANFMGAGLPFY